MSVLELGSCVGSSFLVGSNLNGEWLSWVDVLPHVPTTSERNQQEREPHLSPTQSSEGLEIIGIQCVIILECFGSKISLGAWEMSKSQTTPSKSSNLKWDYYSLACECRWAHLKHLQGPFFFTSWSPQRLVYLILSLSSTKWPSLISAGYFNIFDTFFQEIRNKWT
jgi:hypothetical protein